MKKDRTKRLYGEPLIPLVCQGPGEPGLVSVLIPTFNRAYILGKTIESVLAQTYQPLEIIVVDDGSTDDTRALVETFDSRVHYIYQENAGLAAARNTGLKAARGEFIAFQDSDDLWLPWKLQAQVAIMRRFPELALVWTDMTALSPDGAIIRDRHLSTMYSVYQEVRVEDCLNQVGHLKEVDPDCPPDLGEITFRQGDIFDAMFIGNFVHPPTALMRREHVNQVGGLDEAFAWTCEDYEFFWRLSRQGSGVLIEAPAMLYRVDAEDQLTKPDLHLYIARGNLVALRRCLENDQHRVGLPRHMLRRRLSGAYAWLAEQELLSPHGNRTTAINSFWNSLRHNPFQQRALLLFLVSLTIPKWLLASLRSIKQRLKAASSLANCFCMYPLNTVADGYLDSLLLLGGV